jgi:hypothetical protein
MRRRAHRQVAHAAAAQRGPCAAIDLHWRASIRPSKTHVARVYFKCFRCFIWMLQVFHLDVTKIDQNIAHVAVVMFQVYVPNVLSRF